MSKHLHYEFQKKRERIENLFKEIIAENFPTLRKERDIQVQEAENSEQDKPKEVHTKTYCN